MMGMSIEELNYNIENEDIPIYSIQCQFTNIKQIIKAQNCCEVMTSIETFPETNKHHNKNKTIKRYEGKYGHLYAYVYKYRYKHIHTHSHT